MGLFGSKNILDRVGRISVFPSIGSVVLKKDKKLIVFSPAYLMGKHGAASKEVASKFMNLKTASQLLEFIDSAVSSGTLHGPKVEIKEINFGSPVGTDALVAITEEQVGRLHQEDVRGNRINIIPVDNGSIPQTNLLNVVLVPFDPQFGQGVDTYFKKKHNPVGFEDFDAVYAVLTLFPGKYAPPMNDHTFWQRHALLREMQ